MNTLFNMYKYQLGAKIYYAESLEKLLPNMADCTTRLL